MGYIDINDVFFIYKQERPFINSKSIIFWFWKSIKICFKYAKLLLI